MRPRAVVLVGASWGGVDALRFLFAALTQDFPSPIVVVQHRGEDGDDGMVQVLQHATVVPVREAEDKEPLVPGRIYLAPAGYHTLVEGETLALSTEAPVSRARPSIDVLFETAAMSLGPSAIAVVLTGAGRDGPLGAVEIKRRGGLLIVQDPATAEVRTLPEAALAAAKADQVLPLAEIVPFLAAHLRRPPQAG